MADMEEIQVFCVLLKQIDGIMKLFFLQRNTALHFHLLQ